MIAVNSLTVHRKTIHFATKLVTLMQIAIITAMVHGHVAFVQIFLRVRNEFFFLLNFSITFNVIDAGYSVQVASNKGKCSNVHSPDGEVIVDVCEVEEVPRVYPPGFLHHFYVAGLKHK